jgi:hypothetical protein
MRFALNGAAESLIGQDWAVSTARDARLQGRGKDRRDENRSSRYQIAHLLCRSARTHCILSATGF